MPYYEDEKNDGVTTREKLYELTNWIVCFLIVFVIMTHFELGFYTFPYLMGPYLPLVTSIVIVARFPLRHSIFPERRFDFSHLGQMFLSVAMLYFAISLKSC